MILADPDPLSSPIADLLVERLRNRTSRVGVIGLGYVGLPLSAAIFEAGFSVLGIDTDPVKLERIGRGESDVRSLKAEALRAMCGSNRFELTGSSAALGECDVVIICVPTPLDVGRDPDLSFVVAAAEAISASLRQGQLVVLESTTYPGTTREILKPILERSGLVCGTDFFLAFSPEREDPGNPDFATATTPKVIGPDGPHAKEVAFEFYGAVVREVVGVDTPDIAEAVKLTENVFRSVNIALANELKRVFGAMNIDIWDVIDAAATKPFGFMPFYPGPGSGGHCIPVDPIFLAWKARSVGACPQLIEQAVEVNAGMPAHVVTIVEQALQARTRRGIEASRILLLGIAYKKNVADIRESPALTLIRALEERHATVAYHDPLVPVIPQIDQHTALAGRRSVELSQAVLMSYDAVLICTDHDGIDYAAIVNDASLVIDTRNATKGLPNRSNVVLA